jgi:fumarate reductase flavoprotein subunit
MAMRAGLTLRDMEMVQFHPTGLLAGPGTRMTGTVLEEGLRGTGGHLLDGSKRRFMPDYDAKGERATRDIVSRAIFSEMRAGRTTPHGGVYISMGHLGPERVRREFKGMVERCADCGFDLAGGLVEVVPTAHYMMGGVVFGPDCTTEMPGLFVAGEDSGGVHGANRLGGNGVANSTVFGGIAGDVLPGWVRASGRFHEPDDAAVEQAIASARAPLGKRAGDLNAIRERLYEVMWDDVGIIRDAAGLNRAEGMLEELEARLDETGVSGTDLAFNLTWQDWLNLKNLLLVSKAICASAAARGDSRGAHYRADFPDVRDLERSRYTCVNRRGGRLEISTRPVAFTRVKPGETLLKDTVVA